MKKLNLKTFFKKFNNTITLNRLVDVLLNKDIENKNPEDLTPHFPAIDKVQDPKDRAGALISHLDTLSPESKIELIDDLKKINNFADKETIKIVKKLLQNKAKYALSVEDETYIVASENDVDLIINIYISNTNILYEADILASFYKKKNWIQYEAVSDETINNESSSNVSSVTGDDELLAIELGLALKETLSDETDPVESIFNIFKYENIDFLYIQNSKDEKEDMYVAFIRDINIVMISGKGNKEKLFTIAECYMRMGFSINIDPQILAYDLSKFKVKDNNSKSGNESLYPLNNSKNLKNWKMKNIELINIVSRDVLNLRLKTNLEHNGMSQMWDFLETLGEIKNLLGYSVNKISLNIEINDSNGEKGFEKINLNINEKTSNLNLLYPSHRVTYQILKDVEVCLGFIEDK